MAKAETGPGHKQAPRASLWEHHGSGSDLTRTLECSSSTESQQAASQDAGPGTTPTSPCGPDCPGAMLRASPAEQHLQLASPAPTGKGKVELPANLHTRLAASPLSPRASLRSCLRPRAARGRVCAQGMVLPRLRLVQPVLLSSRNFYGYGIACGRHQRKGVGTGQRKQRGTRAPAPHQGTELHGAARDPAASFSSLYRSPLSP